MADHPAQPGRPASRRWGGLLRERDFRLLWIGETTSNLGDSVADVALPLVAVTVLHAGTFVVGALTAAAWLPWLIIGLPAGAWIDRRSRRRVLIVADLVMLAMFASIPVASWFAALSSAQLLVVALLTGGATVFFNTAFGAYLPSLVGPEDLVEGNTKLQGSLNSAQVAGPGLAGVLTEIAGAASGVLVDAGTFLVSALCVASIRTDETPRAEQPQTSFVADVAAGLRFVAADPYLRVFAVFGALANFGLTGYQSIEVVFLIRTVGLDAGDVGGLLAVVAAGGIAGAFAARRVAHRFGTARGVIAANLITRPFILLVPLTGPGARAALFAAGGAVTVAGVVCSNIVLGSFRQRYCPTEMIGRVRATTSVVSYSAIPLAALLAGALGSSLGTRPTTWIMTSVLAASPLILLVGPARHAADLPTQPAPAK